MARRTREEAEQTRLAIMDTAMAVFARRGLAGASLEQIACELNVTRGAIYGHFRTKKELFEQVIKLSRDQIYDLADSTLLPEDHPRESIRRFMLGWMALLADDRRFRDSFEILLNKSELTDELTGLYQEEKQLTRHTIARLKRVIVAGITRGELPGCLDPALTSLSIYAHLMGVTQTWLFNTQLFSLRSSAPLLADACLTCLNPSATDAQVREVARA